MTRGDLLPLPVLLLPVAELLPLLLQPAARTAAAAAVAVRLRNRAFL